MNKQELIVALQEELKARGIELSKKDTNEVLGSLEVVVDGVVEAQDEVTIAGMKISTKEQAAKEGVINFGDRQGETYTTPAKRIPTVKFLKSKKDALSVEI